MLSVAVKVRAMYYINMAAIRIDSGNMMWDFFSSSINIQQLETNKEEIKHCIFFLKHQAFKPCCGPRN
jgi:hypothetical protein